MSQTMVNSMMSCFLCEPNSDVKTWKDSIAWIRSGLRGASPLSGSKYYNYCTFILLFQVLYIVSIINNWPEMWLYGNIDSYIQ